MGQIPRSIERISSYTIEIEYQWFRKPCSQFVFPVVTSAQIRLIDSQEIFKTVPPLSFLFTVLCMHVHAR